MIPKWLQRQKNEHESLYHPDRNLHDDAFINCHHIKRQQQTRACWWLQNQQKHLNINIIWPLKVCLLYIKQIQISNNQMYSTNLLQLLHRGKRVAWQESQGMCSITSSKRLSLMNGLTRSAKGGFGSKTWEYQYFLWVKSAVFCSKWRKMLSEACSLAETNKWSTYNWIKMQFYSIILLKV